MTEVALQAEMVKLRGRVQTLNGVLGLLLAVLRVSGFRLDQAYVSDPAARNDLLRAVERARRSLPRTAVLRVLRISSSRYNLWVRAERGCRIEDRTMCPRSSPTQLTPEEVLTIGQMVTTERYRHVPTGRLAVLAQRLGKVFASPSIWYRLARDQGWRRPRQRLHPSSPKVGVRASKPDEIWHIDTSCVRLLDGTKVWLHAVIDNFSRKILAWRVAERFEISNAAAVLQAAVRNAVSGDRQPQGMADGGIENFNAEVDELVGRGLLSRVRALVEVRFSNSMIESWWNSLKHQWLFLHRLETVVAVRRHVEFYVAEYNATIPHAAFSGQTPDEVYFGRGAEVPAELEAAKRAAQARRLAANRALSCEVCQERGVAA
jgi:transposase InsO family protein